jgi:uncharacterized membrane protein
MHQAAFLWLLSRPTVSIWSTTLQVPVNISKHLICNSGLANSICWCAQADMSVVDRENLYMAVCQVTLMCAGRVALALSHPKHKVVCVFVAVSIHPRGAAGQVLMVSKAVSVCQLAELVPSAVGQLLYRCWVLFS